MIYHTTDYSMFKFDRINRPTDLKMVRSIRNSLQDQNKLNLKPIIIDETGNVIDGQHRLLAAMDLGLPIYYVIDEKPNAETMAILNRSQRNWTLDDYLNHYEQRGFEEYIKFKEFMDETGFSIGVSLIWMFGERKGASRKFREGNLKVTCDVNGVHIAHRAIRILERLQKEDGSAPIKERKFHAALQRIMNVPGIDHDALEAKLVASAHEMIPVRSVKDRVNQILKIYNRNLRRKQLKIYTDGKNVQVGM